jgi:thiosulfate/3-mercaptopyruvate sulfurtransferase
MTASPILIESIGLNARLGDTYLQLVDLCTAEQYACGHIPGAVHLDYSRLILSRPPVTGLLPGADYMSELFGSLGLRPDAYIVAYDDEGGGHAARLLWSLVAHGHTRYGLLNGGLQAWVNEGFALDATLIAPTPNDYPVTYNPEVVAEYDYIAARLDNTDVKLLDCRSPQEYRGDDKRTARAGHIPGASNMEWTQTMDAMRNLRLKPPETLLSTFAAAGVTRDREVITYCQTHHRSAHTWLVLKALGFERVRGYPGSWSEWGNRNDTPID